MDIDSLFNLATYKDNDIFSRWGDSVAQDVLAQFTRERVS